MVTLSEYNQSSMQLFVSRVERVNTAMSRRCWRTLAACNLQVMRSCIQLRGTEPRYLTVTPFRLSL